MTQCIPVLVGFNLISETFDEVKFPHGLIDDFFKNGIPKRDHMLEVTEVMGALCLILINEINSDIWWRNNETMEWTRIARIHSSSLQVISLRPIYMYGKSILCELNSRKVIWYNLETNQISFVEGIREVNELQICIEALTNV
jgi:hypothetical protein